MRSLRRWGTPAGGKTTIQPGRLPVEEFATLAHNLAQELMHRAELPGASPQNASRTSSV